MKAVLKIMIICLIAPIIIYFLFYSFEIVAFLLIVV